MTHQTKLICPSSPKEEKKTITSSKDLNKVEASDLLTCEQQHSKNKIRVGGGKLTDHENQVRLKHKNSVGFDCKLTDLYVQFLLTFERD
jgi:hypothetical protein